MRRPSFTAETATGPSGVSVTLDELVRLRGQASGFSFLPRQPVTSLLAGRHGSRLRGRGLSFEELRHYQPGDDIRTIDWRATARLRSPYVRVYTEERERPVLFVVDQRVTMFVGSKLAMKSVAAAQLAALGAWRVLASGDRVGGLVFNDSELVEIPPHRSQTRVLRLLHEVTRLNQLLQHYQDDRPPAPVSLNQVLEAAVRRAKHDYLVVLISDFDGADTETQRLATRLAAHNDVLAVAVYDPLGATLWGYPGMVATDRGVTCALPTGEAFAQSFQRAFAARLDHWMETFRALRVPVIPISAAQAPIEQLHELFGNRLQQRIDHG